MNEHRKGNAELIREQVSMVRLAQFPLKDGGLLVVEGDATDSPGSRVMRGSNAEDAIAQATNTCPPV